jgi:hypothetical protein
LSVFQCGGTPTYLPYAFCPLDVAETLVLKSRQTKKNSHKFLHPRNEAVVLTFLARSACKKYIEIWEETAFIT